MKLRMPTRRKLPTRPAVAAPGPPMAPGSVDDPGRTQGMGMMPSAPPRAMSPTPPRLGSLKNLRMMMQGRHGGRVS